MEYQKLRVWKKTNYKLKVEAAIAGKSVIQFIDDLVSASEEKRKNGE